MEVRTAANACLAIIEGQIETIPSPFTNIRNVTIKQPIGERKYNPSTVCCVSFAVT